MILLSETELFTQCHNLLFTGEKMEEIYMYNVTPYMFVLIIILISVLIIRRMTTNIKCTPTPDMDFKYT